MDLPIVLSQPGLHQLCEEFFAVVQDSLERLDYSRALDLAGQWLLRLDQGPADERLPEQKALIRLWRVDQLVQLQRWDQATQELDTLLCRRGGWSHPGLLARALIFDAQLRGEYGEQDQALACLEQARTLEGFERHEQAWQLEKARWLTRAGDLESALQTLPEEGSDEVAIERGRVLFRLHRFAEAEDVWLSLTEQAAGLSRFQAEAWRLLGLLHQELSEPQPALDYLKRALKAFWQLQIWIGVAKCYEGLGQTCAAMGKSSEAFHFTDKAERLCRRLGAESELAVVYGRLGNLCMKLGDFPRAIRFHQLDVDLCSRFGNFRALSFALSNLALSHRAQGDHQQAQDLLTQALDRFLQLGERVPLLKVRVERARTSLERNLLSEAAQDLQAAALMLQPRGNPSEQAQIHVLLCRLERLQGRLNEAWQHLKVVQRCLGDGNKDASVRSQALREQGYLLRVSGQLEQAAAAFSAATRFARKGEQQRLWAECLEQLDRLDELAAAEVVLEGLQRNFTESQELLLNPPQTVSE